MVRLLLAVCVFALPLPLVAQPDQARDAFNFAAGLHDKGLHDRAVKAFEDFLARWPKDARVPKARFYLGQSLADLGRADDAIAAFGAYLASGDASLVTEARLRAGELLHRGGKHAAALPHLEAAASAKADASLVAAARYFLGEAAVAAGEPDRGRKAYEALVADFPQDRYASFALSGLGFLDFKAERFEDARQRFAAALERGAKDDLGAECRVMVAECLLRAGKAKAAAAAFREAIAKGSASFQAQALAGLAQSLIAAKDVENGLLACAELASRCPDDARTAPALIRAAAALHEQGRGKEGLAVLERVRNPRGQDAADLAYWKGVLLGTTGAKGEGLESLRQAVAAKATPQRKFNLAQALSDAGKHEEAAGLFAEVRRDAKDEALAAEAGFGEAYSRHRLGKPEDAVRVLEAVLAAKPAGDLLEDATFALAENLFALERYEKAREVYARLCGDGSKRRADAVYKRGWCSYQLKKWDEALADFEAFVKGGGSGAEAAEARYLVAKCHEGAGRSAEARAAFEAAGRGGDGAMAAKSQLGAAASARLGGDAKAALESYRKAAAATDPALRGEALLGLGDVLLETGKAADAERAYRSLADEIPGHPKAADARLGLAWALRAQKKHAESAAAALALADATKDVRVLGEALYLAALGTSSEGRHAEAAAILARSESACPQHARAGEARLLRGISLARAGKPAEAEPILAALAKAKEASPARAAALYEWSFCLDALKKPDERDRALAKLVELQPESELVPDALFRLAESAYGKERFAEALPVYERVATLPAAADLAEKAVYKAAWCQRKLGRHAEASALFERVAANAQSALAAESAYLGAEEAEDAKDFERALAGYRRCAKNWPDHELASDASMRAVLCQHAVGDADGVIKSAPPVLASHAGLPRALKVREALGDAFFAKKQWGRARAAYREVTNVSEGEAGARAQHRIGLCHLEEGEVEKALDELLKVAILYGHEEWVAKSQLLAADLLAKKGEGAKARRLYEDLVKSHAAREEARAATQRLAELDKGERR